MYYLEGNGNKEEPATTRSFKLFYYVFLKWLFSFPSEWSAASKLRIAYNWLHTAFKKWSISTALHWFIRRRSIWILYAHSTVFLWTHFVPLPKMNCITQHLLPAVCLSKYSACARKTYATTTINIQPLFGCAQCTLWLALHLYRFVYCAEHHPLSKCSTVDLMRKRMRKNTSQDLSLYLLSSFRYVRLRVIVCSVHVGWLACFGVKSSALVIWFQIKLESLHVWINSFSPSIDPKRNGHRKWNQEPFTVIRLSET